MTQGLSPLLFLCVPIGMGHPADTVIDRLNISVLDVEAVYPNYKAILDEMKDTLGSNIQQLGDPTTDDMKAVLETKKIELSMIQSGYDTPKAMAYFIHLHKGLLINMQLVTCVLEGFWNPKSGHLKLKAAAATLRRTSPEWPMVTDLTQSGDDSGY